MSALNPVMRLQEHFVDTLAAHGERSQPAAMRARFAQALESVGPGSGHSAALSA